MPPLASECVFCAPRAGAASDHPLGAVRAAPVGNGASGGGGQGGAAGPVIVSGKAVGSQVPPEVRNLGEQSRVYYCKIGGQTVGPVTAADIRDAFSKGQIDGHASVGIQGRKEWFAIRALPQFSHLITGVGRAPSSRSTSGLSGPEGPAGGPGIAHGMSPGPAPRGASPRPMPPPSALPRPMPAPGAALRPMPPHGAPPRPSQVMPVATYAPSALSIQGLPGLGNTSQGVLRNDETLVVPPLPHPALLAIGASTAQVRDPQLEAWQKEVRSWRRRAIIFQILTGVLLIVTASLLGILLGR